MYREVTADKDPYLRCRYRPYSDVSSLSLMAGQAFLNIPMMPDDDLVHMCSNSGARNYEVLTVVKSVELTKRIRRNLC